jgi:hypothetical protein
MRPQDSPALRCRRLRELFGVATKAAQLDQNAKPVREELAMTHLSVEHSEPNDGCNHHVTTSGLHPTKVPLMCATDSPEGDDVFAFRK